MAKSHGPTVNRRNLLGEYCMTLRAEFLGRATGALLLAALAVPVAAKAPAPDAHQPENPVKDGVDAWSKGDFTTAIHLWQGPAAKGDPDGLYDLGEAYQLGRGVPQDLAKAEALFGRAAAKGHLQAADNYGLLLFQRGQHAQAMPYIRAAADRGDPRAQYVLGITYFNGEGVATDWVRAYALENLSEQAGWPPARKALTQMDTYIPLDQRQQAVQMAADLAQQAEANRNRQMAASDFGVANNGIAPGMPNVGSASAAASPAATGDTHLAMAQDRPRTTPRRNPVPASSLRGPDAQSGDGMGTPASAYAPNTADGDTSPPSAPAYAAPAYTPPAYAAPSPPPRRTTPMGLPPAPRNRPRPAPADGSGSYTSTANTSAYAAPRPATGYAAPAYAPSPYNSAPNGGDDTAVAPAPRPAARSHTRPIRTSAPAPAYANGGDSPPAPAVRAAPSSAGGMWKVQLGAFGVAANADAMWTRAKALPEIAGHPRQLIPTGKVNRLLATGFSADGAQNACRRLIAAGMSCIATRD